MSYNGPRIMGPNGPPDNGGGAQVYTSLDVYTYLYSQTHKHRCTPQSSYIYIDMYMFTLLNLRNSTSWILLSLPTTSHYVDGAGSWDVTILYRYHSPSLCRFMALTKEILSYLCTTTEVYIHCVY